MEQLLLLLFCNIRLDQETLHEGCFIRKEFSEGAEHIRTGPIGVSIIYRPFSGSCVGNCYAMSSLEGGWESEDGHRLRAYGKVAVRDRLIPTHDNGNIPRSHSGRKQLS